MKVNTLLEQNENTKITWRQNGDGSWTARIERDGRVFVHTNKNKATLEKLVNSRYS